jgi:hypothetical protein
MFGRIHANYDRIGTALRLGEQPPAPQRHSTKVIVPVVQMSRLTAEAVSTALSIGDDVVAVTVCYADPDDEQTDVHFRDQWEAWHPNVPLVTLRSMHRSLAPPIVKYLRKIEDSDDHDRVLLLIPEVQPAHWWQGVLFNQRGSVLQRAIERDTANVVICRLRYRLATVVGVGGSG